MHQDTNLLSFGAKCTCSTHFTGQMLSQCNITVFHVNILKADFLLMNPPLHLSCEIQPSSIGRVYR